ncbi:caspase, EACC1-associated type [Streptomyces sp. 4.24]|uniref:caspase, EACC1-associated type n=1 Tax=Streptomyces tritrimontium TaxID=3406573 RepID=UPI003BB5C9B0
MELADPQASYAVLIGTSVYTGTGLKDIPPVANNLEELGRLLEDPGIWGLPPGHCVRLPEPSSAAQVLDAVREAAEQAADTLLVYYAGHGLSDPDSDELLLTLPSSDPERSYSSLRFEELRREIRHASGKLNKVVILDCCYSGLAMAGAMGGSATESVALAEQTRIAGSYLLTASAATREALWLDDEPYTAFTGELIHLLEHGLPGGGQVIEVGQVYDHVLAELRAKGRPIPQQRVSNTSRIAFARNRYGIGPAPGPAPRPAPAHPVPDDLRPVLRAQPRAIAEYAARLRDTDPAAADRLLTLAAVLRPAQEVAALVWELRAGARDEEAQGVLAAAAAEREPYDLAACVVALHAADHGDDPERLALLAAERAAEDVAGTVKALRTAGQAREAELLLTTAIGRLRTTESILGLAGAFWSAELDAEAERVLHAAATSSEEEATRLAGALLTIGRQDEALDLYLRTPSAVVRHPAELVRVLKLLEERLRPQDARRLLHVAVEESATVKGIVRLCDALWAAGMREWALEVLRRAATVLRVEAVIALAEVLRGDGQDEAMLQMLRELAGSHPVAQTVALVVALRTMGRPLDAVRLLTDAARRPGDQIAELLILLEDQGHRRDWNRVLEALPEGRSVRQGDPPAREIDVRIIELIRVLHAAGRDHRDVTGTLASLPEAPFAEALGKLRDAGADDVAHHVLCRLARSDPQAAVRRLPYLGVNAQLDAAVLRGLLRAADSPVRDSVTEVSSTDVYGLLRNRRAPGATVSVLTAAGLGRQIEEALEGYSRFASIETVIQLLGALRGHSLTREAHTVVRGAGWMFPELYLDFVMAMRDAGLTEYAVYGLEWNAARLGRLLCERLALALGVPVPAAAGPPRREPAPPPSVTPRSRPWHRFGRG